MSLVSATLSRPSYTPAAELRTMMEDKENMRNVSDAEDELSTPARKHHIARRQSLAEKATPASKSTPYSDVSTVEIATSMNGS